MAGRDNWKGSGFHADVVIQRVLDDLIQARNAKRTVSEAEDEKAIKKASAMNVGAAWEVLVCNQPSGA